jgi:hypothetical protein
MLWHHIWDEQTWVLYTCTRAWGRQVISSQWIKLHLSMFIDGDPTVMKDPGNLLTIDEARRTLAWLCSPQSRRSREIAFNKIGFVRIKNPRSTTGQFSMLGERVTFYARAETTEDAALRHVQALCHG